MMFHGESVVCKSDSSVCILVASIRPLVCILCYMCSNKMYKRIYSSYSSLFPQIKLSYLYPRALPVARC